MTDKDIPAVPEDAANPPAAAPSLTGVELGGVTLAIVGAAALTFAVLTAGGSPSTEAAAAPGRAAASAATPAPVVALLESGGPGWAPNAARWTGNARRSVAVEVPSVNKVSVWMRDVRPLLVVRCLQGHADAFVFTDSAAMIEAHTEDHTVRYAFDTEAESSELWPDSTEHDALFAPDGGAFARRLMAARTLRFGFTPHNAAPVTAHFRVSGLREQLGPATRDCGLGH